MKKSLKQKLLKSVSVIVLAIMVLSINSLNVSAGSGKGITIVNKGGKMMQAKTGIGRKRKYSYVNVTARSVYPYPIGSRDDNFTKCKTRLYHNSIRNKPISTTYAAEITYDYNGK